VGQGSEADQAFAKCHESFMDIGSAFKSDSEAAKLVEPTQGAFGDPAIDPQSTSVWRVALGKVRFNWTSPGIVGAGKWVYPVL